MIYLPWIAFLVGMAWMIQQGFKAKKQFLQRKAEECDESKAMKEQKFTSTRENKTLGTV